MKVYQVLPNILCVGRESVIRIFQRIESRPLPPDSGITLEVIERKNYRNRRVVPVRHLSTSDGGVIEFSFSPETPGEYLIHINIDGKRWPAESVVDLRVFALDPDQHARRPLKGDMHMHTFYSDGDQSPAVMAARCKQMGLDFAAITDHRYWRSSVEAAQRAEEYGFDILMIPGEECNYCIGLGHVLSYGARECVSDRIIRDSPFDSWSALDGESHFDRLVDYAYEKMKHEIEDVHPAEGVDRRAYAFYAWVVREIHNAGGIAVAAHPYWVSQRVVDLITPVYETVLANHLVDAFELFGAVDFEDNILSLGRYVAECAAGRGLPLWANSDSHDVDFPTFGKQFTVAFAEEKTQTALFDAILGRNATGCFTLQSGESIVVGPPLLTEYTYFLLREVFPEHDSLCRTIGDIYQLELRDVLQGRETQHGREAPRDAVRLRTLHAEAAAAMERHFTGVQK